MANEPQSNRKKKAKNSPVESFIKRSKSGQWVPGQSGHPNGRPPSGIDRSTIIRMALAALDRAGGIDYLVEQAHAEPKAFLAFIGKIIPRESKLEVTGELNHTVILKMLKEGLERSQAAEHRDEPSQCRPTS